jgi:hypothetical protein
MMARKKHPGGRKPQGEYSELAVHMSMRMPKQMHKRLTAEARARKRSATQELLRRLDNSFKEDERRARDPALKALLYLIAQLAESVGVSHVKVLFDPVQRAEKLSEWRTDPFQFKAFKAAVHALLAVLPEPPGEPKRQPPMSEEEIKKAYSLCAALGIPLKDGAALTEVAGAGDVALLFGLSGAGSVFGKAAMSGAPPAVAKIFRSLEEESYGVEAARRALALPKSNPEGGNNGED